MKVKSLSHVRLVATPWTAAHQAPPSMGFFRQEYWSGVPLPSPKYLMNEGINEEMPIFMSFCKFHNSKEKNEFTLIGYF